MYDKPFFMEKLQGYGLALATNQHPHNCYSTIPFGYDSDDDKGSELVLKRIPKQKRERNDGKESQAKKQRPS